MAQCADADRPPATLPRPFAGGPPTDRAVFAVHRPTHHPELADDAARRSFVETHYERLYAWLFWLSGNADVAADLTQEAFAGFWASCDRVAIRRPRIWLYRIARNQWRRWCRNATRTPREGSSGGSDTVADTGAVVDPAAALANAELARALTDALASLPPHFREPIALRYWADLDHADIGRVLGIPAALVRWRVHRARQLLRAAIERSMETNPEDRR